MRHATASPSLLSPVLIAGSLILMIGFSIRASFGVFQIPIANEFGWARAEFSLAIALQNLAWGFGQPIFGTISERLGNRAAVLLGGALYALGLVLSAFAITPGQHQLLEIIVGFGVAGTGFGVILGVVGRATPEKHRSMAMGIATAAGSAGQVFGAPVAEIMLGYLAWQSVFLIFAGVILLAMFAVPFLNAPDAEGPSEPAEPLGRVLSRALKDPSYILIFVGFFSCGYQLAFITAHFPAMVTEMCGAIAPNGMLAALGITTTSVLGAVSISVIGLANIAGTITAGWLGARYSRKNLLAGIYVLRTLAAAAFILKPITPVTVLLFSVVMGALCWPPCR